MSRSYNIIFIFLYMLIVGFSPDNPIQVKIDKNDVKTGEILTYEIEIKGKFESPELILPGFKNFNIISQTQTKRYTFEGGDTTVIIQFIYHLFAQEPGTFDIEPVILKEKGHQYRSDKITINVKGQSLKEQKKLLPYLKSGIDI